MSIVLDGLTKRFGHQPVVDRLSLELGDGELFVLLGSSGSGKSTVLRLIAGLLAPDAGRVVLHDRDVTGLAPQERGVGFVFQNFSIFRHMTAAKNIEFGLRIRGVAPAERAQRREELLDLVGLGGLGGRYAHQLSGGQLQRVALARALAYQPAVLLLDEPFGALDAKIRSQLRRSLREVQRQLSVTTILVTHDQEEAFEVADRIGVLERGRLLEQGTARALYERPRTLFVATFVGAGTVVVGRADEGLARFGAFSLPIPADAPHETGARVLLLCRPEDVVLSGEEPGPGVPVFGRGSVVDESFAGAQRRVRVRVPRVPRIRQVSPVPVFGEENLLLEALVPPERELPPEVWVSLRAWKILDRPAPRVLAVDRGGPGSPALEAAAGLAKALDGTMSALTVTEDAERIEALAPALRDRAGALGATLAEARVRAGRFVPQVLAEQSESVYDVLVLDRGRKAGGPAARSRAALLRIVERSATPTLIVPEAWPTPRRILVCTAVGEPGKTVIRMAGWLARNLGAAVTLFHAQLGPGEPAFVHAHLERGLAALRAMDVPCELAVRAAQSAAEGILAESARSGAEMIAIGAPGPGLRSAPPRDDVVLKVVAASPGAVLIVPASAW